MTVRNMCCPICEGDGFRGNDRTMICFACGGTGQTPMEIDDVPRGGIAPLAFTAVAAIAIVLAIYFFNALEAASR